MKIVKFVAVLLALAAPIALAKDKRKDNKPSALFSTARFVYVQAEDGAAFNPNLLPEDREAIGNVEDALADWKRYVVTDNRSEADLVIIVRKGRAVSTRGTVTAGAPSQIGGSYPGRTPGDPADPGDPNRGGMVGRGIGVGTEAGLPDDTLRVFSITPDGKLSSSPIWWREMKDGLDAPEVILFRSLRTDVERAYPPQPAPAKKP
jgi:hypothetical protein